jgi:hypothetical protein
MFNPITTVQLERFTYMAQSKISKEGLVTTMEPEVIIKDAADHIIMTMKQGIFGKQLEHAEVSYPSDWWQAIKEHFAPKWFTQKYPIIYKCFIWDVRALYPTIPKFQNHTPQLITKTREYLAKEDEPLWHKVAEINRKTGFIDKPRTPKPEPPPPHICSS